MKIEKRDDYLSWEEYFMSIAYLSSQRSKDPNTQVGACLIKNKRIIGIGYNGLPRGIPDQLIDWSRDGKYEDTKYPWVVHAEINAILNSNMGVGGLEGSQLYTTLFPCEGCAGPILQTGIEEIIYLEDKYDGTPGNLIAKRKFDFAGLKTRKFSSDRLEKIRDFFEEHF